MKNEYTMPKGWFPHPVASGWFFKASAAAQGDKIVRPAADFEVEWRANYRRKSDGLGHNTAPMSFADAEKRIADWKAELVANGKDPDRFAFWLARVRSKEQKKSELFNRYSGKGHQAYLESLHLDFASVERRLFAAGWDEFAPFPPIHPPCRSVFAPVKETRYGFVPDWLKDALRFERVRRIFDDVLAEGIAAAAKAHGPLPPGTYTVVRVKAGDPAIPPLPESSPGVKEEFKNPFFVPPAPPAPPMPESSWERACRAVGRSPGDAKALALTFPTGESPAAVLTGFQTQGTRTGRVPSHPMPEARERAERVADAMNLPENPARREKLVEILEALRQKDIREGRLSAPIMPPGRYVFDFVDQDGESVCVGWTEFSEAMVEAIRNRQI